MSDDKTTPPLSSPPPWMQWMAARLASRQVRVVTMLPRQHGTAMQRTWVLRGAKPPTHPPADQA